MNRDLQQTIRRYEATESSVVKYKGLPWDEFESFLAELKLLEKVCDQLTPPPNAERTLRNLRAVRRLLRSAPINPGHPSLHLNEALTTDISTFPLEIKSQFEKCLAAISVLLQQDKHPAWEHIETLIAKNLSDHPERIINAVVLHGAVETVDEIAKKKNWNLHVADLTRAKKSDITDLAIVFGSPEFHANWRLEFDEQSRSVAWLFNSPIAQETHVVSWPGNYKFDPNRYVAWQGVELQNVSISGSTHFAIEIDRLSEISSGSSTPPRITDAATGHIAPVKATPIKLTNDTWIFLSDESGPSANFVDMDDFDVVVRESPSIKKLTPGMVLVVRDDDAGRSFLEDEALNWIVERDGTDQMNESLRVRDAFRKAVQELGKDQFCMSKLHAVGLDEAQATRRLRLAHDPNHIAPQEKEEFFAICSAAGLPADDNDWKNVVLLRTAFRQAGHRARKLLELAIQSDTTWQGVVETPAMMKISLTGTGSIVLAPIIEVFQTQVEIPISRLGQLQTAKGNA